MKKVLITGANGYIGRYLENSLNADYNILTTDIQDIAKKDYFICDLTNKADVDTLLEEVVPDVIVHCAGTKDLFGCEKDREKAYKINVDTTKNIGDVIRDKRIKFIFLSSDYIFSGDKGMYKEDDKPNPGTVYGRTKLACEEYIKTLANYTICRTASVYGMGSKFFGFILDSLKDNKPLDMYDDAYFSPTYIGNLSNMIECVIKKEIIGILHTAGPEKVSRYEFALRIAKNFRLNTRLIRSVHKPKDSPIANDSSLDVNISMKKLGIRFIGINEGLQYMGGYKCIL